MTVKLLIVDDDANIQRLYKEELEDEGYQVCIAGTGAEALEMFVKEKPDDCRERGTTFIIYLPLADTRYHD